MTETAVIINGNDVTLFGSLIVPENSRRIAILVPAVTGTRIGPQRIYVQLARALAAMGYASLRLDMPWNGDSYSTRKESREGETVEEILAGLYHSYLDVVDDYLRKNHAFDDVVLLSISVGCLPVLHYARSKGFGKVVLLSPSPIRNEKKVVNRHNIRLYIRKLFFLATWKKILTFDLKAGRIVKNIFVLSGPSRKTESGKHLPRPPISGSHVPQTTVDILNVFGDRDSRLPECRAYWKDYKTKRPEGKYAEAIIQGADHSFFGWQFKMEVIEAVTQFLKEDNVKQASVNQN